MLIAMLWVFWCATCVVSGCFGFVALIFLSFVDFSCSFYCLFVML